EGDEDVARAGEPGGLDGKIARLQEAEDADDGVPARGGARPRVCSGRARSGVGERVGDGNGDGAHDERAATRSGGAVERCEPPRSRAVAEGVDVAGWA